jgi:GDSL-like lipase/acylhydrolase family protein
MSSSTRERIVAKLHAAGVQLLLLLAMLLVFEGVLRVVNFRMLRDSSSERSLTYQYDAELGWAPVPNSSAVVTNVRTIHARHNSLGLRDIEFVRDGRPAMLFIGDSFVWGLDVEAEERFTDLLRPRIPDYNILNAGVSGYGTDQEYLLLQRLWPKIEPKVVVLVFCTENDRLDNTSSVRYESYQKPYFATLPDGSLELRGEPVPKSRQVYVRENWLVRHSLVARVAVYNYVDLVHAAIAVPDPTEKLIGKIRDFVEAHGAKLVVGMQKSDEKLSLYLADQRIAQVAFDGAESYSGPSGAHWTPEGQKLVADRLFDLLSANGLSGAAKASH